MFAESPGLNAVEHPVFDVWLTDCEKPNDDARRSKGGARRRGRDSAARRVAGARSAACAADRTAVPSRRDLLARRCKKLCRARREVREHATRAGALEGKQAFHHRRIAVEPTRCGRGLSIAYSPDTW